LWIWAHPLTLLQLLSFLPSFLLGQIFCSGCIAHGPLGCHNTILHKDFSCHILQPSIFWSIGSRWFIVQTVALDSVLS
jgi:hypothetical protein